MEELSDLLKRPVSLLSNEEKEKLATSIEKLSNVNSTVSDINLFIEQCITLFNRILENNPNDLDCIKKCHSKDTLIDKNLLKNFSQQIWEKGKSITDGEIIAIIRFIESINTRNLSTSEQIAFRELCNILYEIIYYPVLNISFPKSIDNNVIIEYADERRLEITKLCQKIILSDIPKNSVNVRRGL